MLIDNILIAIFSISLIVYTGYLLLFFVGYFLPRKQFASEKPKVSVIVAARDEEGCIKRCIDSLCRQTYSKELFEVIIVNDQSDDSTAEIVESLQNKYKNLQLINITNRPKDYAPKKYAINEALKISSGEIILSTDADITVKPTWIESIVSFFEKDVGLVAGFSSVRDNQTKKCFQKFEALDFLMLMTATKGSIRIGIPISCTGQNLSFSRKAFDDIGGFGEENKTQSADDVLLLHRMHKSKNWKIAFADDKNAFVETDATTSLIGFLKQRIRWTSMGAGQFTKSFNLSAVSIATAIVNTGLLFLIICYSFLSTALVQFLIIALIIKLVIEFIIAVVAINYGRKKSWLWWFPVLFVFYMPYVLIMSFFSVFGNFKWKDRVYKKRSIK